MVEKNLKNPFQDGSLEKPVIAAVNGFAMGGGFMLVERTDLRVAVKEAVFEMSEAKRWLLGGYNHGHYGNLPHPIATEMAFGYRISAERMHQIGFVNRLVDAKDLMSEKLMAEHLLTLPPASRVNTLYMMKHMAPKFLQIFLILLKSFICMVTLKIEWKVEGHLLKSESQTITDGLILKIDTICLKLEEN